MPGPLYVALKDFKCRAAVQSARLDRQPMPPCWDNFVHAVKDAGNRNIFMSSEDLSVEKGDNTEWWRAVQQIGAEYGYDVIVIVAYRRLYEWYPSCKTQISRGGVHNKKGNV